MKRTEGLQLAQAHSALSGTPNWGGIVSYIEKMFKPKKTAAERKQLSLFSDILPTPLKQPCECLQFAAA